MKIFQVCGKDTALISDNYHYTRLTEDCSLFGHLQSIDIFITTLLADEVFQGIGRSPADWDCIIADGKDFAGADLVLYAEGIGIEQDDKDLVASLGDKCVTIKLGKSVFPVLEVMEYTKNLLQVDNKLTAQIANLVSPLLNIPAQSLIKAVSMK
jgi:hypothetical protein